MRLYIKFRRKHLFSDSKEINLSIKSFPIKTRQSVSSDDCLILRGKSRLLIFGNIWRRWSSDRRNVVVGGDGLKYTRVVCSASNTDWHLTTHEFVSPGKDSTSICATSLALRRGETRREVRIETSGRTSKNASWLSPNSRRRFYRQYPTRKRELKWRLTEYTPLR